MITKKSLKDISWQISEEEYRNEPDYSYSKISRFNREGFNGLLFLDSKQESPSLTFGSLVDCLITEESKFHEKFVIVDNINIPTSINNIIMSLYNEFGIINPVFNTISDIEILEHINKFGYYPNWKDETRIKSIKEKGQDFYNLLVSTRGKEIISRNDYEDAMKCVNALKETRLFDENPFNDDIEILYQLKFKGEYENIPLKCMMDFVIIDYKNKIIYPWDLKTSSNKEWDFPKSFLKWGYYIQAQLYYYILKQNIEKDEYFKDFTIFNYQFLVINRYSLCPLKWIFSETKTEIDLQYGNYKCKNWRNILKELHYYLNKGAVTPIGIDKINSNNIIDFLEKDD